MTGSFGNPPGVPVSDELACMGAWVGGRRCPNPSVVGAHYCAFHNGLSQPQMLGRRERSVERYVGKGPVDKWAAKEGLEMKLGAPRNIDPGVALLEEVHRTAGHVAYLEDKVRGLEESELVWGTVMEVEESRSGGQGGDYELSRKENRAVINQWWDLYARERRHLAQVALAAVKAGIEERRVRLAERGVDALEFALSAALTDLGLDPRDPHVRAVVGARLREAVAADIFGANYGTVAEMQTALASNPHMARDSSPGPMDVEPIDVESVDIPDFGPQPAASPIRDWV